MSPMDMLSGGMIAPELKAAKANKAKTSSEYADDMGLRNLAENGPGYDFSRPLLEIGYQNARSNLLSFMTQANSAIANRGMDFSGVVNEKIPGMGASAFASDLAGVSADVMSQSEQMRSRYQEMYVNQLRFDEQMALEREKLEAQKPGWLDYLGTGASLMTSIALM